MFGCIIKNKTISEANLSIFYFKRLNNDKLLHSKSSILIRVLLFMVLINDCARKCYYNNPFGRFRTEQHVNLFRKQQLKET